MAGVRRWAWNIFCALSLLVFVSNVTLWVRSCWVREYVAYWRGTTDGFSTPAHSRGISYSLQWTRGTICVSRYRQDFHGIPTLNSSWSYVTDRPAKMFSGGKLPDDWFYFVRGDFRIALNLGHTPDGLTSSQYLIFPLWLFLIFALPPLLWWRKWRKRNRRGFPVEAATAF